MMSMVLSVLSQDPNLTLEEATELVTNSKRAALAMFPDKELAYDLDLSPTATACAERAFPNSVSRRRRKTDELTSMHLCLLWVNGLLAAFDSL